MSGPALARKVGKYRLYSEIGSGGMGSVHLGQLFAPGGFRRLVAIKRLHPHLAQNEAFLGAFLDEALLASRIHHPNVIAPLDVVATGGEVLLVLEYVPGLSLGALVELARAQGEQVPLPIAVRIVVDVLGGLQAAHEATNSDGTPLALVHRDVSPQNVLVGKDGSARLLDFGIAKAHGRTQTTEEGLIKGKRGYMAPEHLVGRVSRASDIYSSGVVLFEVLTSRRLFPDEVALPERLAGKRVEWPEGTRVPASLQRAVLRALCPEPGERYATARDFSVALEAEPLATSREIGEWLARVAEGPLRARGELVARVEAAMDGPGDGEAGGAESSSGMPRVAESSAAGSSVTQTAVTQSAVTQSGVGESGVVEPSGASGASDEGSLAPVGAWSRGRVRAGAVVLALAAVVLVVVLRGAAAPVPAVAMAEVQHAAALEPTPAGAGAPASSVAPEDERPAPSSAPAPSPAPAESGRVLVPAKSAARGTAPPRATSGCKPYVLDAQGRTQFNEACLRRTGSSGR